MKQQRSAETQKKLWNAIKKQKNLRAKVHSFTARSSKFGETKEGSIKSPCSTLQKIIETSRRQMQAKQISEMYHTQKLEKLLASNECRCVPVYPNGDCLIKAVSMQLDDQSITPDDISRNICPHILENFHHYSGFMKFNESLTEDEQVEQITTDLKQLEKTGNWQSDYADFVPLCLSNIFQRQIRIFSSSASTPIFFM